MPIKRKLTPDDLRLIRELIEERERIKKTLAGLTNRAIADKFGISLPGLEKMLSGKTYRGK